VPADGYRSNRVLFDVFRNGAFWDMRGSAYVHESDAPLSDQAADESWCRPQRNSGFVAGEERFT
jgi:hypothetical protein